MQAINSVKRFCKEVFTTPLHGEELDAYESKTINCQQACIGMFLKVAMLDSLVMALVYGLHLSKMHLQSMYAIKLVHFGIFLALYVMYHKKVPNFDICLGAGHLIFVITYFEDIKTLLAQNSNTYVFVQGVVFGSKSMFIFEFYRSFRIIIFSWVVQIVYIYVRFESDVFMVVMQLLFVVVTYLFLGRQQFGIMEMFKIEFQKFRTLERVRNLLVQAMPNKVLVVTPAVDRGPPKANLVRAVQEALRNSVIGGGGGGGKDSASAHANEAQSALLPQLEFPFSNEMFEKFMRETLRTIDQGIQEVSVPQKGSQIERFLAHFKVRDESKNAQHAQAPPGGNNSKDSEGSGTPNAQSENCVTLLDKVRELARQGCLPHYSHHEQKRKAFTQHHSHQKPSANHSDAPPAEAAAATAPATAPANATTALNSTVIVIHCEALASDLHGLNTTAAAHQIDETLSYEVRIVECAWGEKRSYMLVFNDISAQVRAKMLREANRYKDQVLAMVTHDFKVPLSGMMGQIQLVRESQNVPEMRRALEIVFTNCSMLTVMVQDILDHSQMVEQKFCVKPHPFDVRATLREAVDVFQHTAALKRVDLCIEVALSASQTLLVNDKMRFKQVLFNLISNAMKFTHRGRVTVRVAEDGANDALIVVSVIDTGVGIPEHIQKRLFVPFNTFDLRSHSAKTGASDGDLQCDSTLAGSAAREPLYGVGLGLSITQNIARELGPHDANGIQLVSKENEGSTFTFKVYKVHPKYDNFENGGRTALVPVVHEVLHAPKLYRIGESDEALGDGGGGGHDIDEENDEDESDVLSEEDSHAPEKRVAASQMYWYAPSEKVSQVQVVIDRGADTSDNRCTSSAQQLANPAYN